jgi:hypothetical protein
MGMLLQDDMIGIGKSLQDVMSGYIAIATCCMGHAVIARFYELVYSISSGT